MSNTWPGGTRHAMYQSEHEARNGYNYPGTRQMCFECDEPTGRCEDDGYDDGDGNPLCFECHVKLRCATCDWFPCECQGTPNEDA